MAIRRQHVVIETSEPATSCESAASTAASTPAIPAQDSKAMISSVWNGARKLPVPKAATAPRPVEISKPKASAKPTAKATAKAVAKVTVNNQPIVVKACKEPEKDDSEGEGAISDVSTKESEGNLLHPKVDEASQKWTSVLTKKTKKLQNAKTEKSAIKKDGKEKDASGAAPAPSAAPRTAAPEKPAVIPDAQLVAPPKQPAQVASSSQPVQPARSSQPAHPAPSAPPTQPPAQPAQPAQPAEPASPSTSAPEAPPSPVSPASAVAAAGGAAASRASGADQYRGDKKGLQHFERIEVGIEDDLTFHVVRRLIGPRGRHMQDITSVCRGAKVWICGRGSRSWEDSEGPLVICVGATTAPSFESAVGQVQELLNRVHEEHRKFLAKSK